MYNRYIPSDSAFQPLQEDDCDQKGRPPQSGHLEGLGEKVGGLLKRFHLSHVDSGDILLLLILLFLFSDSEDNLDLIIILGLAVAFGLFHKEEEEEGEN